MSEPTPAIQYTTRTKLVVVVVLALAIGAFVLAGLTTVTDDDPGFAVSGVPGQEISGDDAIQALVPGDGDEVVAQQKFGIDLSPGWTGELLLLPSEGNAVALPVDELELVPELNQIFYQPQPGKRIERLAGGTNCVVATIWNQVRGREATERVKNWCFSVV